ncbi:MAG: hypothetical protein HYX94_09470 [Chloroflexi bacterium]|nr:hypothetical protein [Chloroflexota bacterium]
MAKGRKPSKVRRKSNKPRISLLHVLYLVVAIAMVVSLFAGIFGGTTIQSNQSTVTTGDSAPRDTGQRIPVAITPAPLVATPPSSGQ